MLQVIATFDNIFWGYFKKRGMVQIQECKALANNRILLKYI